MEPEKFKKIRAKMDTFMAEIGQELLDPEMELKINDEIKRIFKNSNVPYTRMTLTAFREGVGLCTHLIASSQGNMADSTLLLAATSKLINDIESRTKKQVEGQDIGKTQ